MKKLVFTQKQMISTSHHRVEHPFAGQNTQQLHVQACQAWAHFIIIWECTTYAPIKEREREREKEREVTPPLGKEVRIAHS